MKYIKLMFYFAIFFFFQGYLFSQVDEEDPPVITATLILQNFTSFACTAQILPVSMVMNGNSEYNIYAKRHINQNGIRYDYNASVYLDNGNRVTYVTLPANGGNWPLLYDWYVGSIEGTPRGEYGCGIYKMIFTWGSNLTDTLWFEQDAGNWYKCYITLVPDTSPYGGSGGVGLIYQIYRIDGSLGPQEVVTHIGRYLKVWDPYPGTGYSRPKDFGNFYYSTNYGNTYTIMPQDSRRDCDISPIPDQNHEYYYDKYDGNLSLKLTVHKNIHTPTENEFWILHLLNNVEKPLYLNILSGSTLKFSNGSYLTLNRILDYPGTPSFIMTCKEYGTLTLDDNTKIIAKNDTRIVLECNSVLNVSPSSSFEIQNGGIFCNEGADVFGGVLHVYYSGRSNFSACKYCAGDNIVEDSTIITLQDGASWDIPDNTTLYYKGSVTSLQMNPGSKINFGQNSKLIFQDGAHLVADSATFTSLDDGSTWDGIYLSDMANDTITNCVIQNAVNGINIQDKNYSVLGTPTVEISNCTFSNTTNTQLTNGVFVNNCSNVLIKDNEFMSTQLNQGFASGVIVEYCLPGSPVIIDNNIDKVLTGIFSVQSSPYIARNTITGVSASGKGIELDNSNGTIKYNLINNFVNSYITLYSSPYLLKNTFNNASETNLNLSTYSIPVMRPVNSGSTLSWLAGNNYVLGTPSNAGISYENESYPSMDSGFNAINVNGSNYMSGEIPSSQDGELMATKNYWTDNPPASQKFSVSGGEVIYDPTFDGSTYPPTDYTELNDIGFRLFDTVFVETLGDNPGAENLFMQAYQKERNHHYLQAVNLYKQVVINYRNSSYAAVSLSRIFNCMEKRLSNVNEYQLLQNYMNQLKTNNIFPIELREIAEDFVIKAKVKQGLLQQAISDYETMYQQNQNNMKGIHALINKECLILMSRDTGDAPNSQQNYSNIANHKIKLLSLITGRDLTQLNVTNNNQLPIEYKLYQNYPNPFNPKTTIKYDLPKEGFVTFKVYDILGKELYSTTDYRTAGTYQITLDGSNFASGLYFYRIETGNYVETKKMVLIK